MAQSSALTARALGLPQFFTLLPLLLNCPQKGDQHASLKCQKQLLCLSTCCRAPCNLRHMHMAASGQAVLRAAPRLPAVACSHHLAQTQLPNHASFEHAMHMTPCLTTLSVNCVSKTCPLHMRPCLQGCTSGSLRIITCCEADCIDFLACQFLLACSFRVCTIVAECVTLG